MAGWIKKVKAFQFKGILVILGCFLLIGAILFAERSGLSYREKAKKLTYLDADKVVTEETAIKTLKPTCLVLTDSSQANSTMAWIQFEQIFKDMKVGTDLVDVNHESIPEVPCSPLLFKRILMYPLLSRSLELYPQVTQMPW